MYNQYNTYDMVTDPVQKVEQINKI